MEIAGPAASVCGRLPAEAGAEVVKIEPPGGVAERHGSAGSVGCSSWSLFHDTGKRGVTLNIEDPHGAQLLRRLAAKADVIIEGLAPGRLARLGLSYEHLSSENPGLVLTSITPFGQDGPYQQFAANDLLVFAMGGVMFISGEPGRPPVVAPDQQAYVMGGTHGALGTLAALWSRRESGQGDWVDVSMFECLVAQENTISNFLAPGEYARRAGSQHRTSLPGRIFRCRDGWVHVFITREEPVWQRFLEWIGHPEELADPGLWEINARWRQYDLVDQLTERFLAGRTQEQLFVTAQALHLPCVPVNRLDEFLADPQTSQNHPVLELSSAQLGSYRTLRPPFLAATELRPAPAAGEHNAEIYGEWLGIGVQELAEMQEAALV